MSVQIRLNSNKDTSRTSSNNHSYINLNQRESDNRIPSYNGTDKESHLSNNRRLVASPKLKIPDKLEFIERNTNTSQLQSNTSLPRDSFSPGSIKSLSRPASISRDYSMPFKNSSKNHSVAPRPISIASSKSPLKLQTIEEDVMVISIDRLLKLCYYPKEDIQINALGYLQHLTYNNPENKMQVRENLGLPILVEQIDSGNNYVAKHALGVLKNMTFTDIEIITTDIVQLGGIPKLIDIIRSTEDVKQKELAIDILWNLSVKYHLKGVILRDVVPLLVKSVIIWESGMLRQESGNYLEGEEEIDWSTMLRNALGIIRNVSYENIEARTNLRETDGLIDCVLYIIFQSGNRQIDDDTQENEMVLIDSKIVENCVCILRNITYAIQEIIDPEYLKRRRNPDKKINKSFKKSSKDQIVMIAPPQSPGVPKGVELLWNSKYIVTALYPIMKNCANAVTLEAATGVIQNLTAGDWEPSKEIQAQFRIQLALPSLIELIDFGTNEVIRTAATALRNLVQEEYCRKLIGKNGLQHLTDKIPFNSNCKQIEPNALAAILSTIYVIIFDEVEFMKYFVTNNGAHRCLYIRDNEDYIMIDDDFPKKINVFSQCILNILWKTSPVQSLMKKAQIKQTGIYPTSNQTHSTSNYNLHNYKTAHDSMLSNHNDLEGHYPIDQRYLRDSVAEIVSNQDLRERTSVAYTTRTVPGYGDVRQHAQNIRRSDDQIRLGTIKSESRLSSINNQGNNKVTSQVPSYHTRENSSLHNAHDYSLQTPHESTPISIQIQSSINPSHSSRGPRSNGDADLRLPTNNHVSLHSNISNDSYKYAKPRKPQSIQNFLSPR